MGSDLIAIHANPATTISIHAPRMGSDNNNATNAILNHIFQSTLPGWGATGRILGHGFPVGISIHAPRMGSDARSIACYRSRPNFNPRSPDGERRTFDCRFSSWHQYFNPRSPDGERRDEEPADTLVFEISIHAPRMGSDATIRQAAIILAYFNPRSPDGERRTSLVTCAFCWTFQSTLPGWGAT